MLKSSITLLHANPYSISEETMRAMLMVPSLLWCLLFACASPPRRPAATPRERAYLASQQYDDAPLDIVHYKPITLPGFKASADEPMNRTFSLAKAKQFLDTVALTWTRQNKCGTCHTNLPYLVARPLLGSMDEASAKEIRESLYMYLAGITTRATAAAQRGETAASQETPRGGLGLYMRVPTVSLLAVNDGLSGRSDPRTLAEFDRVWAMQRADGSWYWPTVNGFLPFLERDLNYVTTLVVLGAGYLPKSYLETPAAATGLRQAVAYLKSQPPRDLHAEIVLLWASIRTPSVMDAPQRSRVIERVRALQRDDGGWSLPSFGHWKRHDGPPNDPINGPSDGYATGLATFALCQAGVPASDPAVDPGLRWLRSNQRESGRWFTRSLYSDLFQNYLSNMGTAYAVMALQTCPGGR